MGNHHPSYPCFQYLAERVQLQSIESCVRMIDLWQGVMRIGVGIAVAREMFGRGQNIFLLHSLHISDGFFSNIVFIFSKRTEIDHRVVRIVVDIYHRGEIHMQPYPFYLICNLHSHFMEQFLILDGT